MGLSVYYPSDVRNALLAAEQARLLRSGQAVNATTDAAGDQDDPFTAGFLAGYRAALITIALAFGLIKQPPEDHSQAPAPNALLFARWA